MKISTVINSSKKSSTEQFVDEVSYGKLSSPAQKISMLLSTIFASTKQVLTRMTKGCEIGIGGLLDLISGQDVQGLHKLYVAKDLLSVLRGVTVSIDGSAAELGLDTVGSHLYTETKSGNGKSGDIVTKFNLCDLLLLYVGEVSVESRMNSRKQQTVRQNTQAGEQSRRTARSRDAGGDKKFVNAEETQRLYKKQRDKMHTRFNISAVNANMSDNDLGTGFVGRGSVSGLGAPRVVDGGYISKYAQTSSPQHARNHANDASFKALVGGSSLMGFSSADSKELIRRVRARLSKQNIEPRENFGTLVNAMSESISRGSRMEQMLYVDPTGRAPLTDVGVSALHNVDVQSMGYRGAGSSA